MRFLPLQAIRKLFLRCRSPGDWRGTSTQRPFMASCRGVAQLADVQGDRDIGVCSEKMEDRSAAFGGGESVEIPTRREGLAQEFSPPCFRSPTPLG